MGRPTVSRRVAFIELIPSTIAGSCAGIGPFFFQFTNDRMIGHALNAMEIANHIFLGHPNDVRVWHANRWRPVVDDVPRIR